VWLHVLYVFKPHTERSVYFCICTSIARHILLHVLCCIFVFSFVVDGVWSEWIDLGNCTRECGGGTQEQFRSCNNPKASCGGRACTGPRVQNIGCNPQCCPGVCVRACVCMHLKLLLISKI